ncbi:MAG: hypothetical protein RRZ70_02900 [Synergistaceae bacterium]
MAENLAQEIREQEALAKGIITEAKKEATKLLASAQADAEQSLKTTKQQCHRHWRESIANAEKEAELKAQNILAKGEAEAKVFYDTKKNEVEEVSNWLVREVVATYGSCPNV